MTKASQNSFRKAYLLTQMSKAIENEEEKLLSLLQSFWVHRYGVSTIPTLAEITEEQGLNSQRDFNSATSEDTNHTDFVEHTIDQKSLTRQEYELPQPFQLSNSIDDFKKSFELNSDRSESNLRNILDVGVLNEDTDTALKAEMPRPPLPNLKKLRRWMPVLEDNVPEAS